MSDPVGPLASVEQVRDELRRLGYLDTGLDRFVLAGADSASALRSSLAVALRVGLAGGVLLGGSLTLAALGLESRLAAELADLALLAVYLVACAALASALLALVGGLAAALLARHLGHAPGPAFTRNVGLAVSVLVLLYAGLWWRSHAAESGLAVQLAAPVVALGLALALGRFVSLAAVAVLSAAGAGERLPRAGLARRRLAAPLAAAAALIAAGVAAATTLGDRPPPPPDFAVVPTRLRVRVVGIDGLDPGMVEQLRGRGELPHLSALLDRAALWTLEAEPEAVPAIVWTTYATGRGPEAHGIRSAGAVRLAGMRTALSAPGRLAEGLRAATELLRITRTEPPTAPLRGAKAFWTVAAEKGLGVGVVNWWATWPAEPVDGYLVSDRAFFKLESGGDPDREVSPPEAFGALAAIARSLEGEGERAERIDRFQLAAAEALRRDVSPDLEALYLPGLDIVTMQQLGGTPGGGLAGLEARLERVRRHYRFLDERLGELAASLGERDVLLLIGDPGRFARGAGATPEGLVALVGPVALPGVHGRASGRDLAPTILHLCGLPVSRELEGAPLVSGMDPGFRQSHPVRHVSSYGRGRRERGASSQFDSQLVEELKALGYIP